MLRIEPHHIPRDLKPANVTPRRARGLQLRVAPTLAPRMRPTWAPQGGAASVDWEAVVGARIPKSPRLPDDMAALLSSAAAPRRAAGARPHLPANIAEAAGLLGELLETLRRQRLAS